MGAMEKAGFVNKALKVTIVDDIGLLKH